MLLTDGELAKARALLGDSPRGSMVTPSIVLALREKDWGAAVTQARAALGDAEFPLTGRATVAALGRFAAKKAKVDGAEFAAVLERSPLGPLARKNPALRAFVDG